MTPAVLLIFLVVYFSLLLGVAYFTSRKSADNSTFFVANRSAKWYMVAFGMIGTALSGVTFISVPGAVGNSEFGYFQRSEEHTSELQSLIRISYAVFCLNKKNK